MRMPHRSWAVLETHVNQPYSLMLCGKTEASVRHGVVGGPASRSSAWQPAPRGFGPRVLYFGGSIRNRRAELSESRGKGRVITQRRE
jgi:hypothetical protein